MSTYNNQEKDVIQIELPKGKKNEYTKFADRTGLSLTRLICKLLDNKINSKEYVEDSFKVSFQDKNKKMKYSVEFYAIKYHSNDQIKLHVSFINSDYQIINTYDEIFKRFEIMNGQNLIRRDFALKYAKEILQKNTLNILEYKKYFDIFFNEIEKNNFEFTPKDEKIQPSV